MFGLSRPTFYKARTRLSIGAVWWTPTGQTGTAPTPQDHPRGGSLHRADGRPRRGVGRPAPGRHRRTLWFGRAPAHRQASVGAFEKKRSKPRCRHSRWSCVGGALRGFATRHGCLGRSPPFAAQISGDGLSEQTALTGDDRIEIYQTGPFAQLARWIGLCFRAGGTSKKNHRPAKGSKRSFRITLQRPIGLLRAPETAQKQTRTDTAIGQQKLLIA